MVPVVQSPLTVYIADSDSDVGSSIKFLLQTDHIESIVFSEGQKLLNYALATPPDCIVVDAVLPDISAVMLLKRLREHGLETPVIILANSGEVSVAVKALKLGAWDYFEKPCLQRALLNSVEQALQRKQ